ncbi:MAG: tetratricopeptide repeat protein [Bacteroidetes bacterium]|nr:MAG: tetratricopeptide repeat protein [Bacteroidota bacterium]
MKKKASLSPKNDRLISFIVFAFAFLLYANTLHHGYVLDDDVVYVKNKDVQAGFSGIKNILNHSFTYGFTGNNDQYQSYRPIVLVFYAIEKALLGNNPHTGHFINVLFFALSCLLLYKLINKLFLFHVSMLHTQYPLFVVLLFAAHPIHTEAVANIKGRDEIMNLIFFEFTLLFILKHIDTKSKKDFFLSVLFFFLSLLCKEVAVTFLAIIPMTVYFFRNIPIKQIAVGMLPLVAVFGLYMLLRSSILDPVTVSEKMKIVNNALAAATNESDRMATALLILGKYIQLLFFPHPLSWDYSFNQIPIVSFMDIKVIGTLGAFAALGIYCFLVLQKMWKQRYAASKSSSSVIENAKSQYSIFNTQIFAFCILFFFITMSVVSNIFIMIGSTLGERFLFVPSIAFCLAVAFALHPSPTLPKGERGSTTSPPLWGGFRWGLMFVILALFSFKTFTRNKDWKDNLSLFTAGVEATPGSSRAQSALGSSYREMGEKEPDPNKRLEFFKKAVMYYKKAIEILPGNTEALYNAGVSYYGMGDKDKALNVYEQALKAAPNYVYAANNAGVIYFERKEYENAKKYFLQAIKYDPNNSDALGNLGAINHNQGNMKEAVEYYKRSLSINPVNQNVRGNLAKAEQALGQK